MIPKIINGCLWVAIVAFVAVLGLLVMDGYLYGAAALLISVAGLTALILAALHDG